MPIKSRLLRLAAAVISVAALLAVQLSAQSMITGYWQPLGDQDSHNYAGGPDPGEFPGLPITDAMRKAASTYDENEMMIRELQCRPFSATYGPRTLSTMRLWETLDPVTQRQTKIEMWMAFAAQHRTIWMPDSGQTPPPAWAPHSWQGYSTGRWVGDELWVHTSHLKEHYLQRSQGLILSDRTTMDERMFRYGDILVNIMMISDPAYLSQPFVYSKLYVHLPQGAMDPYPCQAYNHVPMPEGHVPMRLPFYTRVYNRTFMSHGIPLEAARGGEQTMFPEYQDYMKTLPLNPPLEQILEERERQQAEQDAIRQGTGR
ncbi:MAG: hypothetical protein HY657_02860 [Acidobacteria bacterium]|nr:hypothetical protein [Acidobacteriota bacterium]